MRSADLEDDTGFVEDDSCPDVAALVKDDVYQTGQHWYYRFVLEPNRLGEEAEQGSDVFVELVGSPEILWHR